MEGRERETERKRKVRREIRLRERRGKQGGKYMGGEREWEGNACVE